MKIALLLPMFLLLAAGCRSEEPASEPLPEPEARADIPSSSPASADADTRPVILAFGDSLTAGYGLLPDSAYPRVLQDILDERGYEYRVVNAGINGDTTSGGLARLQPALDLKPSIVILELGANDGLRGLPIDEMRANLDEMIRRFQKAGAGVVLAGMTLPRNYGSEYVRSFEDVFIELARQYQLPLIPFFLEGVAGQPDLTLQDFLHPNAKGYRVVTETVLKTLEPVLKK
jgi:acyl-CoA thioesterase-1